MTLGRKIFFGFGMALVLSAAVLLWAILNLRVLGRSSSSILSENYRSIIAAEHMIHAPERQDSAMLMWIAGDREAASGLFGENTGVFYQWFARAEDNITIEGEAKIVTAIGESYRSYLALFPLLDTSGFSTGIDAYRKSLLPVFLSVRDNLQTLRELNQKTMYAASERTSGIASRAVYSMAVVGGAALLFGFLLVSSSPDFLFVRSRS